MWYDSYMAQTVGRLADGHPSMSSVARHWIEGLPSGTWFRSAAVPGPGHVVRNVLSRLMGTSLPIIGRAARGIYWRQPPPADSGYGPMPLVLDEAISVLASPGSCYARFGALSRIGWSTQMPCRTILAVPYRNLTPPVLLVGRPVRFEERSNTRRRSLNWNEANLLEAARSARRADYHNWDHAVWLLTEANGWMKQGEPIRKEMVLWAAETEPLEREWQCDGKDDKSFDAVIARLSDDLPDLVEAPWNRHVNALPQHNEASSARTTTTHARSPLIAPGWHRTAQTKLQLKPQRTKQSAAAD